MLALHWPAGLRLLPLRAREQLPILPRRGHHTSGDGQRPAILRDRLPFGCLGELSTWLLVSRLQGLWHLPLCPGVYLPVLPWQHTSTRR